MRGTMLDALIVEDQPAVAKALGLLLDLADVSCRSVATPAEALAIVRRQRVGVVLQDMNFSPGATTGAEGMALFRDLRALDPSLPVVALTAWTSLETAVQMVREGASDYVAKPWNDAKLVSTVRALLETRRATLAEAVSAGPAFPGKDLRGLVVHSAALQKAVALALQVAAADVPVLITGPNGAGKEKIAEIVQANSRRRERPFVRVNAGALPDELFESELFGAEPGAYTGALRRRVGRFEAADGGTLFLDEIGNLTPAGQAKLLRVLQSGTFERLGSSETRKVDVRILAATNADLRALMARGQFREDLFFRLSVIEIAVPPLRDRREDVMPLAQTALAATAGSAGRRMSLSPEAQAALLAHPWPGNVRELMNRIQRAVLVAKGALVEPADLGLDAPGAPRPAIAAAPDDAPLDAAEREEKQRLEEALRAADGMVSKAATRLGMSRQALYRRMERLGIVLERRPR